MARRPRAPRLETRSSRLKLPVRKRPFDWTNISPRVSLGYRRCKGPGRWVVRVYVGNDQRWEKNVPGVADDQQDADGENVLSFLQAMAKATEIAGQDAQPGRPATLSEALDDYEAISRAERASIAVVPDVRCSLGN